MRPRRMRGDDGASLVFALAFITLLSAISVSVLGLSSVSSRTTRSARDRAGQLYAADAGIEYAIQKVQAQEWCVSQGDASPPMSLPVPINGKTVTLTCQTTLGGKTTNSGSPLLGEYVAILGNEGVTVNGGGWDQATFHGNVYSNGPASIWWSPTFTIYGYTIYCSEVWDDPSLNFPHAGICAWIDVEGNLEVAQGNCPPQYVYPTGTCTPNQSSVPDPAPQVRIPATTALPPADIGNNCTILYPGRYTNTSPPLAFDASKRYYMASGTYYFAGTSDVVLRGQIFGGAPSPATPWEDTQLMHGATPCSNDVTAQTRSGTTAGQPNYDAAKAGTGVTIVRGSSGKLRVDNENTKIELYTRVPAPASVPGRYDAGATPGVTFWANTSNTEGIVSGGGTYTASNPPNGEVFLTQHKDADVVIHGLSYLPKLRANLQEPFNAEVGSEEGSVSFFLGGVVAKKLTVVRNLEGFVQKVALAGTGEPVETFANRTTTVTATAPSTTGGASSTVIAIVKPDEPSGPTVVSWHQG